MTQGQRGEEFTRSAAADRGVVLEFEAALQNFRIPASQPTKPQARQTVSFAHGTEADRAFVDLAGGGEAICWVVLEFAIHFVAKNDDSAAGGKLPDLLKGTRRHQKPRRIVGRVDVNDSRVGLDEFFESSQIVRPTVFITAPPLADLRPGAACQFERAFVARRLHDDVITGPGKRVIENKNAFLGSRCNEDMLRLDSPIHS